MSVKPLREKPITVEAREIVLGERQSEYGDPVQHPEDVAAVWSRILGTEVSARDVYRCMIALKLIRDVQLPARDNEVDIAGYAQLLQYTREADDVAEAEGEAREAARRRLVDGP